MTTKTKEQRGLALFRDHARQIVEVDSGVYWVPSCSGGSYPGTLSERPGRRHGEPRDNRLAPRRGSAPSAGAGVDSLCGVRVSADTLDTLSPAGWGSEMDPNITAYDITIQVRDAGEKTTACGWVKIDDKRHELRVEADVSS